MLDLSEASSGLRAVFPDHSSSLENLLAKAESEGTVVASLPKKPPVDGPTLTPEQAYILRASAVDASEMIVEIAHSLEENAEAPTWMKEMTLPDLDMWLWSVAKDRRDYRNLERFVLRDTIMF